MSSKAWLVALVAVTLPLSFGALAFWAMSDSGAQLEATVAGGLIGILSSIATGFFHTISNFDKKE